MPAFFFLDLDVAGACSLVELNGVPLAIDDVGEGLRTLRPLNEWLRPGDNALYAAFAHGGAARAVGAGESAGAGAAAADAGAGGAAGARAGPPAEGPRGEGPMPPAAAPAAPAEPPPPSAPAPPHVRLRIFEHDPGSEQPKPLRDLALLRRPDEAHEDADRALPFALRLPFTIAPEQAPPVSLWEDAEPVRALDDADRAAILAGVEGFRAALAERRLADAYALAAYKFEDGARAEGIDPDKLRRAVLSQYHMFLDQPGVRVPPLPARLARYVRVAGGKLVQVWRGASPHTVLIQGPRRESRIRLFFAKIGGAWRIAR